MASIACLMQLEGSTAKGLFRTKSLTQFVVVGIFLGTRHNGMLRHYLDALEVEQEFVVF